MILRLQSLYIWSQVGHNAVTSLARALRLELSSGMLSRQLACARACMLEVDGGSNISLCIVSDCLQAGVYLCVSC